MNRLTFSLSGEHTTIPASEVLGAIEAEGYEYRKVKKMDQVLVLETNAEPIDVFDRLGMVHWIGENFAICSAENLKEAIANSDLIDYLPQSEKIAVRVKRIKQYQPETDTQKIAKEIADIILSRYDYRVDLENPDNEIKVLLTRDSCVVSVIEKRIDRGALEERKPPKRPALHPSTMQPNLGRAMVNMARTPRNGNFLDPFCGVGGIMIEAGLVGANPIGVDISEAMLDGARKNLEESRIRNYELVSGDAREIDFEDIDAIATDPPYGRQASTGGVDLDEIYGGALPNFSQILKTDGYLCITAPKGVDLEKIVEGLSLSMEEKHEERVHKSLTRNIYVFRKVEG